MTFEEICNALPSQARREVAQFPYPKIASGKVREIFDLGDRLLIVATDRLSAFDVVLPDGVPGKGLLLTQLSLWWFERTQSIIQNHLVPNHAVELCKVLADFPEWIPYAMLVRKLAPVKLEAVVRGYLSGSGWKEYQQTGELWGRPLPVGLVESSALPKPLFTPTTKADVGDKDLPVNDEQGAAVIGEARYEQVRSVALKLYDLGVEYADKAGLILADTKFEFGVDEAGELFLIDEALTPDSSRYWPKQGYAAGKPQPAFDKQYVRDYLETLDWDKTPPGPSLPEEVIMQTREKYLGALKALMG
ncbi:phosphoribosylaminoimidazolesuccinocarboxamide synthase [Cerasicoccus fimbriatus]|uniref:phosphoribosylaminoimidazolesuccinocarboxamide synthase n=1 Tax=Cerasicoccus fimbriatus TaxID=3014554 RepID=UPI0022B4B20D|nr:phosphoribosylaminoimidazolesuccinocarboxamide synthase [Cerasicoccus sp. TK19100]